MERVAQAEDVTERVGRGERDRRSADDRRIEEEQREDRARGGRDVDVQALRDAQRILVVAELRRARERRRGGHHDRGRADHHHEGAQHRVRLLVFEPARRDPLVDHVRLLEEQLPRRHGRAHHGDDQQRGVRGQAAGHSGDDETLERSPRIGMAEHDQRQDKQAGKQEDEHRALPATEVAADRDHDQDRRRRRYDDRRMQAEVLAREAHSHELGADGQEVEEEDAADREQAPEAAEPLTDQPRVADSGDRAEAHDHLLVDDQHRDEQDQGPQQRVPEVLAGLRVGRHPAGVVVADHDDQARADDRREGEEPAAPGAARRCVADPDGAECAVDVTLAQVVEEGGA